MVTTLDGWWCLTSLRMYIPIERDLVDFIRVPESVMNVILVGFTSVLFRKGEITKFKLSQNQILRVCTTYYFDAPLLIISVIVHGPCHWIFQHILILVG
jgi:hypothetical protein